MNKPHSIPFYLTIGVTGHRKIENTEILRKNVKKIINKILENFPSTRNTKVQLRILSPLAEGSDRLVAEEVLKFPEAELKVILPLSIDEYLEDFESEKSKKEFRTLLSNADYQFTVNTKSLKEDVSNDLLSKLRNQAYEDAGRYIVDHSSVLIVIWDELPSRGKGGTASIKQYAESKGCPIFIINPDSPEYIKQINGNGFNKDLFRQIDKFNSFYPKEVLWEKFSAESSNLFFINNETNAEYELPELNKSSVKDLLLPYYTISEIFAVKNKKMHHYIGLLVFWLAFFSVGVVSYGIIYLTKNADTGEIGIDNIPTEIFILELVFLVIIGVLIFVSHRRSTHHDFIDNRFLAEHLRTDITLALFGIKINSPQYLYHIKGAPEKSGWMIILLEHILSKIPNVDSNPISNVGDIQKYIRGVWIKSQIAYHKKRIKRLQKINKTLEFLGVSFFYIAILMAGIHIFPKFIIFLADKLPMSFEDIDDILIFLALLLPALAATLGAIKTHNDYKKIITDSTIMLIELDSLDYEFNKTLTRDQLEMLILKAERIMRKENEDWLSVIASKELEKAV